MKKEIITIKEMKEKTGVKNLSNDAIAFYIKDLQQNGKGKRAIQNKLLKEDKITQQYKEAKHISTMHINIEWNSYTPHAEIYGTYIDGTTFYDRGFTCGGWGYDKESTVISQIFNKYFRYKLYELKGKRKDMLPYGATVKTMLNPYFDYGVGTNCYFRLVEFFQGKMIKIASGKNFDCYEIKFKK